MRADRRGARRPTAGLSVKKALAHPRCLLAADGFYEWKREGGPKRPYFIRLKGGEPFGMAGNWERWAAPSQSPVDTVAILTTATNDLVAEIHDRMPVIVDPKDYDGWGAPFTTRGSWGR